MRLVDSSAWIEWLIGSPTGQEFVIESPHKEADLVAANV